MDTPTSYNFDNESAFYRPQFLEVLVRNLIKEDSIAGNEENVKRSLDLIISLSETLYREVEERAA